MFTKLRSRIISFFQYFWTASIKIVEHDGIEHAGYMSFIMLLAIFPTLLLFLSISTLVGASDIGKHLIKWLVDNMPHATTHSIKPHLIKLTSAPAQSLMTFATVGSIWTASSLIEGLRTILNRIHRVHNPPRYLIRRLQSTLQLLLIGLGTFLVITSLVFFSYITAPFSIDLILRKTVTMFSTIHNFAIYITLFCFVSALYYIIPNRKIRLPSVIPGACVTVTLWVLSGRLFSSYLSLYSQFNIIYGSLGGIIMTLLLFYTVNLVFIYGAEVNSCVEQNSKRNNFFSAVR
ncbi:YihY/virulence factor BrkB family protein [Candidatus Sneabacter namystus]|uniref:YihY/virulence factor BrkB family protein n=1 Tax=Candidatus Sneabacter namystus TaxID=2601646 RepID=A0A5C0UIA4_9RICK|nr:YihY/virulence factor BrkB family protein [Candidatus Sneabacter namystus]QEK39838.1 YihY/virulence factor BrkB family protein [Candidatus Sneabacter namystus]